MKNPGFFNRLNLMLAMMTGLFPALQNICAAPCPCDIYKTAGTPCVAAHSTVRALYEAYSGPLYQVRRTSDNATMDIGLLSPGGYVDIAVQDSFLNGKAGTISIIFDQSPNKNHLTKSPKVLHLTNGGNEAKATDGKHTVNGHVVHGIYVTGYSTDVGYRNNDATGLARNDEPETMYMVVDGKRYSDQCCFDYGNVGKTGTDEGNATMECIYWGTDITWGGKGDGTGPWVAADLENGVYKGNKGGWQSQSLSWPNCKSIIANYATAMLKGHSGNRFVLKGGSAQSGKLTTMWDGTRPNTYSPMKKQGAIVLGTGGDGCNGGTGTFFEGAITSGVPSDEVDDAIQANIVAAGYGSTVTSVHRSGNRVKTAPLFGVHYRSSVSRAVINYTLKQALRVNMSVYDWQGRKIAAIVDCQKPAGRHEAVWDTKHVAAGDYIVNVTISGIPAGTGRIVIVK